MCITVVFLVKLHIYVRIYSKILCYHANWFYLYILEFHVIFFPVIYFPFFFFFYNGHVLHTVGEEECSS